MNTVTLHDGTAIVTREDAPDTRFIVWQDETADDPRHEWDDVQLGAYCAGYRTVADLRDERAAGTGTMAAFLRVYGETGDDARALRVAQRYARALEPGVTVETSSHAGYSQSEWADLVIVCPVGDDSSSYVEEWSRWARGDVYAVMRETFTECENPNTCHGDDGDHWQPITDQGVDSLVVGGIYADDPEDAVMHYVAMGG